MRAVTAALAVGVVAAGSVSALDWQAPFELPSPDDYLKPKKVVEEHKKVNVTLYVMSRCSDAVSMWRHERTAHIAQSSFPGVGSLLTAAAM